MNFPWLCWWLLLLLCVASCICINYGEKKRTLIQIGLCIITIITQHGHVSQPKLLCFRKQYNNIRRLSGNLHCNCLPLLKSLFKKKHLYNFVACFYFLDTPKSDRLSLRMCCILSSHFVSHNNNYILFQIVIYPRTLPVYKLNRNSLCSCKCQVDYEQFLLLSQKL